MLFLVLGLESPVLSPLLVGGGVPGGRSSGDFFYVCPCPRISYLGSTNFGLVGGFFGNGQGEGDDEVAVLGGRNFLELQLNVVISHYLLGGEVLGELLESFADPQVVGVGDRDRRVWVDLQRQDWLVWVEGVDLHQFGVPVALMCLLCWGPAVGGPFLPVVTHLTKYFPASQPLQELARHRWEGCHDEGKDCEPDDVIDRVPRHAVLAEDSDGERDDDTAQAQVHGVML